MKKEAFSVLRPAIWGWIECLGNTITHLTEKNANVFMFLCCRCTSFYNRMPRKKLSIWWQPMIKLKIQNLFQLLLVHTSVSFSRDRRHTMAVQRWTATFSHTKLQHVHIHTHEGADFPCYRKNILLSLRKRRIRWQFYLFILRAHEGLDDKISTVESQWLHTKQSSRATLLAPGRAKIILHLRCNL